MKLNEKHYRIIIDVYNTEDDYEIFRILDADNRSTEQHFRETINLCEIGFFSYGSSIDDWLSDKEDEGYTFEIVDDYRSE